MDSKEKLRQQITDSAGNIPYTFLAHWNIVHRLKKRYMVVKIVQIGLTAVSTGGFLTSIIAGIPWLSWVGGLTSAVALGLNLYIDLVTGTVKKMLQCYKNITQGSFRTKL